jgi:hypothetical protein
MDQFEVAFTRLTEPLNGQLPRPWMTDLEDPLLADLFIVGKNQAKGYEVGQLTHERHINALFNRRGESCRRVYEEMTGHRPSPTRKNTDHFRSMLLHAGISDVLETNVVCYSTPMSGDLRLPEHRGGEVRGTEIFLTLIDFVKPKLLVAHGAGTREVLKALLGVALPPCPSSDGDPHSVVVQDMTIFIIPSLAPPQWNQWQRWAESHLTKVAKAAARALNATGTVDAVSA